MCLTTRHVLLRGIIKINFGGHIVDVDLGSNPMVEVDAQGNVTSINGVTAQQYKDAMDVVHGYGYGWGQREV